MTPDEHLIKEIKSECRAKGHEETEAGALLTAKDIEEEADEDAAGLGAAFRNDLRARASAIRRHAHKLEEVEPIAES